MSDWFVAMAGAGSLGARVVDELTDCGLTCYRPRYRLLEVRRGRKIWREGYLLGCYILVQLRMRLSAAGDIVYDWAEQFHRVSGTRGVRGVLATAMGPMVVREREIVRMRGEEHRGYVPAPRKFRSNQRVEITRGAFVDYRATYKFSDDKFDYVSIEGLAARVVRMPMGSIEVV